MSSAKSSMSTIVRCRPAQKNAGGKSYACRRNGKPLKELIAFAGDDIEPGQAQRSADQKENPHRPDVRRKMEGGDGQENRRRAKGDQVR